MNRPVELPHDDALARGYTRRQRWLNVGGITLFMMLAGVTAWRIAGVIDDHDLSRWGWMLAAALGLALVFADLMSGLVHWSADNWGSESWPIVGGFVRPFRNHHVDPEEMTRHGFVERNGDPCIIALPTFWCASMVEGDPAWQLFGNAFFLGTAGWVMVTNQIHAWAHMRRVPRLVRLLQRLHLILPPEHHAQHHRSPYAKNYCITTGWMDGPLRWFRILVMLEWLLTKLTGVRPLHAQIAEAEERPRAALSA
jgi:ubiquitin-conjugating enzyme E2 variant